MTPKGSRKAKSLASAAWAGASADEFRFERGLAVFEEHLGHLLQVRPKFIERVALRMRARSAGNIADVDAGLRVAFDDSIVGPHDVHLVQREASRLRKQAVPDARRSLT